MYFLNARTIRKLDAETISSGTAGLALMERAGYGAYRFLTRVAVPRGRRALVVAGKGNNAGDALVVARLLIEDGRHVQLLMLAAPEEYAGDAAANWQRLARLNPNVYVVSDENCLAEYVWHGDVIVDGVLGTGIRGEVSGLFRAAIETVNRLHAPVLALDIPSGLHCDTGEVCGAAVRADWTVTFAHAKRGMLTDTGAYHCGRVEVIDIGIDSGLSRRIAEEEKEEPVLSCLSAREAAALLPVRNLTDHKNRFGHLLIIAGSKGMTGAAVLCARSAMSSGAGLVTIAVPESLLAMVAPCVSACMTLPLPDRGSGMFTPDAASMIVELLPKFQALALGPGIGRDEATVEFVEALLPNVTTPIVVDADGLNALADKPALLRELTRKAIITPHPGEFARLSAGKKPGESVGERTAAAQEFADAKGLVVVLKGFQTVIASPGADAWINLSGNPGMATAGSGDVLSGVIGALLAQGLAPVDAAKAGAYIHGLAGDIAAGEWGRISTTSERIAESLGLAFQYLTQ